MKKLLYILLALISATAFITACRQNTEDSSAYFAKLDSLIDREEDFERDKLLRIAELSQKEHSAVSPTDRYLYATLLFDEYLTYNSDSAMKYIDRRIDIARTYGNKEWENRSKIAKIGLLAGTGLLREAEDTMNSVDTTGFSNDLMIEYYGQLIYLYSHLGNYKGGPHNQRLLSQRKSLQGLHNENHSARAPRLPLVQELGHHRHRQKGSFPHPGTDRKGGDLPAQLTAGRQKGLYPCKALRERKQP